MKNLSTILFTYIFLGVILAVGCAVSKVPPLPYSNIQSQQFGGQIFLFTDQRVDCGLLHDSIEQESPFICAPWEDGRDFNRQQAYRSNLRRLYKKHCREA